MNEILAAYQKTTSETKSYVIDYSAWLAPTELLNSFSVAIYPQQVTADPTPLVTNTATISVDKLSASVYCSGGTVGYSYRVRFLTQTTAGQMEESGFVITIIPGVAG